MPLFLSLATALSISAAAFFSGVHYRHNNNAEAHAQAQTNIQSNIEADHTGTADDQEDIKAVSTTHANIALNEKADDVLGLSAIGNLSGIFDNEDDTTVSSDTSEHEDEMGTEDDTSINAEGGIEASHSAGNVSGNAHGTIDF